MADYGGSSYTSFKGVNLKNTAAIRVESNGVAGTLAVKDGMDSARAWYFTDKSGTFPIAGTFTVNLPAISGNDILSTNVTVSGIRAEDGIVATIQNMTTTGIGTRGYVFIGGCQAGNGGVHLTFVNASNTATVYKDIIVAYAAVR